MRLVVPPLGDGYLVSTFGLGEDRPNESITREEIIEALEISARSVRSDIPTFTLRQMTPQERDIYLTEQVPEEYTVYCLVQ